MQDVSALYEFAGIGELAETTTQMLAFSLQQAAQDESAHSQRLSAVERLVLQQARDYMAKVREGFMLSVRAGPSLRQHDLRYLLNRVLADWAMLSQELGLTGDDSDVRAESNQTGLQPDDAPRVERIRHQLLAFAMAVVALGHLPRLPPAEITFPYSFGAPPTYADIPVPHTPAEMLWRIEELEQTLWQLMASDPQRLVQRRYGALRRTYGFFETSALLSRREMDRFGLHARRLDVTLL